MKKVVSMILSIVLMLSMSITAFASEDYSADGAEKVIITTTKEERDAIFEKAMAEYMAELEKSTSIARGPQYHYKTEYLPYEYKTLGGFAGNQVPGGYKFSTGGGFWFTDSGGPSVSASVNISLPKPYDVISISVNLGQKGSSGMWVSAPTTTSYYKLYVSKVVEVRPYITYRARPGSDNWEFYLAGHVNIIYSVNPYAKRV